MEALLQRYPGVAQRCLALPPGSQFQCEWDTQCQRYFGVIASGAAA